MVIQGELAERVAGCEKGLQSSQSLARVVRLDERPCVQISERPLRVQIRMLLFNLREQRGECLRLEARERVRPFLDRWNDGARRRGGRMGSRPEKAMAANALSDDDDRENCDCDG